MVLEAEGDGDLSQTAQAVQSALRPKEQIVSPVRRLAAADKEEPDRTEIDADEVLDDFETVESASVTPQSRLKKNRTVISPKVLQDFDLTSCPSFISFVAGKSVTSNNKKFLLAEAFCK